MSAAKYTVAWTTQHDRVLNQTAITEKVQYHTTARSMDKGDKTPQRSITHTNRILRGTMMGKSFTTDERQQVVATVLLDTHQSLPLRAVNTTQ